MFSLPSNQISVKAAAVSSGCSLQYLRRMLRNGKLAGIKIGRLRGVDEGKVDTLLLPPGND